MTASQVFTKYGNRSELHYVMHDSRGKTLIVFGNPVARETPDGEVILSSTYWDYSNTTHYYRGQFLGENTATTRRRIKDGDYKIEEL